MATLHETLQQPEDLSQSDCAAHHHGYTMYTVHVYRCARRPRFKVDTQLHTHTSSRSLALVPFFDIVGAIDYARRQAAKYEVEYEDMTHFVVDL